MYVVKMIFAAMEKGEKMSKYIEAVSAATIIAEKHGIPLVDLADTFAEIPAADVAPVRHGKWKETEPLMCGTYGNALWLFECSNCGRTYFTTHKYCPSCGAKMDLEE